MHELTPRQSQILQLLQRVIDETGIPPTRAEIAAELGFKSANAAEEHLRALQRKGAIELIPGASRGIRLKDSLREQIGLPLIGRVAAGQPILAEGRVLWQQSRQSSSSGQQRYDTGIQFRFISDEDKRRFLDFAFRNQEQFIGLKKKKF